MVKEVDSTGDLSASQLLDRAPMVLVVLDGYGEILVANGEHLGEVLGEAGPYAGRVLFELPNVATIFGDLVRRALSGPTSIGRLALTEGFLQVRAVPTVNAAGRVCGVVVIGTPEVAQASSDEAFMRLFRASPVPISISTLDTGIFSHCNDAFVRSFGYPREEVVGGGSVELGMWSPAQRAAAIVELKEKGVLVGHESTVTTKTGDIREIIFNMERIEFAGRTHLVGFFYDMTERKRAEAEQRRLYQQLKQVDEIKGQFVANISHELRTPLTLILGLADRLAVATSDDAATLRDLQGIGRNARALLKQVDDLLEIARLDAGQASPHFVRVDLADDLRLFASPFDVVANEKGINYVLDVPATLAVEIDPEKFERITTNLLVNAFKFTPHGGQVRLQLARQGDLVSMAVCDSGPGIAPEHRDSVFERFFQVDGAATRTHGGAGLGLAIVRELVESLRGTISVGAVDGGGTCFEVKLPLTAPDGTEVGVGREGLETSSRLRDRRPPIESFTPLVWGEGASGADDDRGLVLVVEDNPEMAYFVAESLAVAHRVVVAVNGYEGLLRARELRPDVVLTDVMMPQMSGDMLAAELLADPELHGLRIVVMTAKADETFRTRMLQEGVHDFITKPFSINELRARVGHQVFVKQRDDARLKAAHERERLMDKLSRELQQVQKMEAIGRLAGGVAHDFNNLLTVISGYASLLADTPAEPDLVSELAKEIKDAGDRAAALTRQLLTFGRKQVVQPQVTDMNASIVALQKMLRHVVGEEIDLIYGLSSAPCLVHIDPTQLDQVLMNLVINARDAMPDGGPLAIRTAVIVCNSDADRLRYAADLADGLYVCLEVQDSGVGVSEEALESIFDPFFSTKDFGKGTGLGLAIVHGIIQQCAGHIICESAEGQGCLFRIFLPQVVGATQEPPIAKSLTRSAHRGRRILVVDDDAGVREFVVRKLIQLGFEVIVATDGHDALQQIEGGLTRADLVITDVTMPELDGRELAIQVERWWPKVPILFVSGYTDDPQFRAQIHGNDTAFLQKPFTVGELEVAVAEALGSSLP